MTRPLVPSRRPALVLLLVALLAGGLTAPARAAPAPTPPAPEPTEAVMGRLLHTELDKHGAILLLIDPPTGRILDFNAAAVRFYGYPPERLGALTIQDINVLNPAEVAAERDLAHKEQRGYFIFPHRLADGSVRTVEVYSSPVPVPPGLASGPTALLSIVHDVTGKRVAEDAVRTYQNRLETLVAERTAEVLNARVWLIWLLAGGLALTVTLNLLLLVSVRRRRAAQRALETESLHRAAAQEAATQAHKDLQRFAEITAHHLQEPARRVASLAQRLTARIGPLLQDDSDRQVLGFLDQQARRLQALLRDVQLYLAAAEPRSEPVCRQPATVLDGSLRFVLAAHPGGLTLTPSPLPALPPLRIDGARLRDLLILVLDNAAVHGASPAGTPARVDILAERRPGSMLRLCIQDHGPGIPEPFRERVFGVFERLAPGSERTGIGLAIAHRIVHHVGGHIAMTETPGGGCRVVIDLPEEPNP